MRRMGNIAAEYWFTPKIGNLFYENSITIRAKEDAQ